METFDKYYIYISIVEAKICDCVIISSLDFFIKNILNYWLK